MRDGMQPPPPDEIKMGHAEFYPHEGTEEPEGRIIEVRDSRLPSLHEGMAPPPAAPNDDEMGGSHSTSRPGRVEEPQIDRDPKDGIYRMLTSKYSLNVVPNMYTEELEATSPEHMARKCATADWPDLGAAITFLELSDLPISERREILSMALAKYAVSKRKGALEIYQTYGIKYPDAQQRQEAFKSYQGALKDAEQYDSDSIAIKNG